MSIKAVRKSRVKAARHSPYPRPFIPTPLSPSEREFEGMRGYDTCSMDEKVVLCANPMDLTREETPEITRETPEITREETPEMPLMEVAMAMKIAAKKEKEVQLHSEQHQEEIHELHTSPKNEVTLPDNRVSPEYDDDDGLSIREMSLDHEEVNVVQISTHEETPPREEPQPKGTLPLNPVTLGTDPHAPEPLKYGDIVVVDYLEKKKVHKWPAIVPPHICITF